MMSEFKAESITDRPPPLITEEERTISSFMDEGSMNWTLTVPTEPGYYWAVNNGHWIVLVQRRGDKLVVLLPGQDFVYGLEDFEAWTGRIDEPPDGRLYDLLLRDGLSVEELVRPLIVDLPMENESQ